MLVLVLLVWLAIIALILTAVIIGILVLRNHQENRLKVYWTLLLQKSRNHPWGFRSDHRFVRRLCRDRNQ